MRLSKGVFWIAEEWNIFGIPCDAQGNVVEQTEYPLNSKDGTNYNHKRLWEILPKSITGGKPFDYYPRGRVEIRNGRATVYLNSDINTDAVQRYIISNFGLTNENGITVVRFISDGSKHYQYKQ